MPDSKTKLNDLDDNSNTILDDFMIGTAAVGGFVSCIPVYVDIFKYIQNNTKLATDFMQNKLSIDIGMVTEPVVLNLAAGFGMGAWLYVACNHFSSGYKQYKTLKNDTHKPS